MIPVDILTEVLSWLPAKSLMRFKCVCKHWFSLITHPSLVDLYQSRHGVFLVVPPHNTSVSPHGWDRRFYVIDWKEDLKHRVTVHDPCIPFTVNAVTNIVNGLTCFYHDSDEETCIFIYNLTTHESLPLLAPPRRASFKRKCHLGFDPINKEYKLALYWWNKSPQVVGGCDVFTIMGKDNTWRAIKTSKFPVGIFASDTGFCHDGVLYWTLYHYLTNRGHLISFHVGHEKFECINYTQDQETSGSGRVSACLIGGHLSVVRIPRRRYNTKILITLWKLIDQKDNERLSWTKEVITCPFQNYVGAYVRCSHFGLVSLVTSSKKSDLAYINCYDLASRKNMVLPVNNAQGFLSPRYEDESSPLYGFRPLLLVKNIMPLMSNNIEGRPTLGL